MTFPLTMQQAWIRDLGPEWQSPWHGEGWRLVGGGVFVDLRLIFFGYAAGLAGVVWMALRRWRTVDLVPAAVMALSLWHLRAVSDMALLTGPLVAAALPMTRRRRHRSLRLGIGLLLILAPYALWCGATHKHREALWRWNHAEPACTLAAMDRLGLSGRVHSSYLNHWIIRRFGERFQVNFVWEYVAGEHHTWGWRTSWPGNPALLEAALDRYRVDTLILHSFEWAIRDMTLVDRFRQRGWSMVHVDNSYAILVRHARAGMPVYRLLRPWPPLTITPANARPVLEESERALESCPQASVEASFAHAAKINALVALGRLAEAQAAEAAIPPELLGP